MPSDLKQKNYKQMKQFGDFEKEYTSYENSKVVLLPIPYDGTSTWQKGADKGPDALLDASYNLEFYDIETRKEVYKEVGIHTAVPVFERSSPEVMVQEVEKRVKRLIDDNKFVLSIGGEHSVSIGAINAHSSFFKNLTVLQLDAHTDLRPIYQGSQFNHACVMARAREMAHIVQVGIRSTDVVEQPFIEPDRIFYAKDIYNHTNWMQAAIDKTTENVYITLDLDVFDPSFMPSTGTPEPGGLDWYMVMGFLKQVIKQRHVVGMDIVELCPNPVNKAPDFLAAKLVYQFLSNRFS